MDKRININDLPVEEQEKVHEQFARWIETEFDGDDSAAKEHLAAGRAIYYREEDNFDELIKEYPSGKREVVECSLSDDGVSVVEKVIRVL